MREQSSEVLWKILIQTKSCSAQDIWSVWSVRSGFCAVSQVQFGNCDLLWFVCASVPASPSVYQPVCASVSYVLTRKAARVPTSVNTSVAAKSASQWATSAEWYQCVFKTVIPAIQPKPVFGKRFYPHPSSTSGNQNSSSSSRQWGWTFHQSWVSTLKLELCWNFKSEASLNCLHWTVFLNFSSPL